MRYILVLFRSKPFVVIGVPGDTFPDLTATLDWYAEEYAIPRDELSAYPIEYVEKPHV